MTRTTIATLLLLAAVTSGCSQQNDAIKKDSAQAVTPPATQTSQTTASADSQPTPPPAVITTAPPQNQQVNSDKTAALTAPVSVKTVPAATSATLTTVYYDFDSALLGTDARSALSGNYANLSGQPAIKIEGHCDERGSSEYNLALGERRAASAKNYLQTLGYPDSKITIISYGKEKPAVDGHDEAAWAKNRRAEFSINK